MPIDDRALWSARWQSALRMDSSGTPELPVDFVAEQGQDLRIVDVRDRDELIEGVGHVPGTVWLPLERVAELPAQLGMDVAVVVVCRDGARSRSAAQYLAALGMRQVAALSGGILAWRALGYSTSRSESVFDRQVVVPAGTRNQTTTRLGKEEIEHHLGDVTHVRWVRLAALLVNGKRSCVDGRDDQAVIGTPGGDAGELILALGCLESVTGRLLSDDEVEGLLVRELDTFGRFYMHTDVLAWERCFTGMRQDARLKAQLPPKSGDKELLALTQHPPRKLEPILLEHLLEPISLGCGHLRLLLTQPEAYGLRPDLVRAFLRAYYLQRWRGAPELDLVTLGGEHNESAVLSVSVEGDVWDFSAIPLISPAVRGNQLFVFHPQVARRHREHYVEFFAQVASLGASTVASFRKELHQRADQHLALTLSALASGLPHFEAHFEVDSNVRVREIGRIPPRR